MKSVPQAIAIASDPVMKIRAMTGKKQITIREGLRDYKNGLVVLYDEKDPWVVVAEIVDVQWKRLSELTKEEWEADGFVSVDDMLQSLKSRFYPNITLDSNVTVVRWNKVSGFLTTAEAVNDFAEKNGLKNYD